MSHVGGVFGTTPRHPKPRIVACALRVQLPMWPSSTRSGHSERSTALCIQRSSLSGASASRGVRAGPASGIPSEKTGFRTRSRTRRGSWPRDLRLGWVLGGPSLEHLECGMQPRFRDARLRLPSATDGKRYDGPEGKRQGRMPVGGIGLGGPKAAIDPEEQAPIYSHFTHTHTHLTAGHTHTKHAFHASHAHIRTPTPRRWASHCQIRKTEAETTSSESSACAHGIPTSLTAHGGEGLVGVLTWGGHPKGTPRGKTLCT